MLIQKTLLKSFVSTVCTVPLYLRKENLYQEQFKVIDVISELQSESVHILLQDSIFHPQGGGQPNDVGVLFSPTVFTNSSVSLQSKIINQQLYFRVSKKGLNVSPKVGDSIEMRINHEKRKLYSRIHSAGHLIDLAVLRLNFNWKPSKGYHFEDHPYVEYGIESGMVFEKQQFQQKLQHKIIELLSQNLKFQRKIEQDSRQNKADEKGWIRYISIAESVCPCAGTHVGQARQIGNLSIRKLAKKSNKIRVSYELIH